MTRQNEKYHVFCLNQIQVIKEHCEKGLHEKCSNTQIIRVLFEPNPVKFELDSRLVFCLEQKQQQKRNKTKQNSETKQKGHLKK